MPNSVPLSDIREGRVTMVHARLVTVIGLLLALAGPHAGWAADGIQCCMEACGNPSWFSCGAGTACTGGYCAPPLGSAIAVSDQPCNTLTQCPSSEAGQCADGVNNDAYQNDLTDCADPACFSDPVCARKPAPALSPLALAGAGCLLAAGGIAVLRRRRRQSA